MPGGRRRQACGRADDGRHLRADRHRSVVPDRHRRCGSRRRHRPAFSDDCGTGRASARRHHGMRRDDPSLRHRRQRGSGACADGHHRRDRLAASGRHCRRAQQLEINRKTGAIPMAHPLKEASPIPRRIVQQTRGHGEGFITRLMSPTDLGQALKPFVFLDIFDADRAMLQA
ncbi:MAG: hypothetical protein E5X63_37120, partial [Mesorhizobium sp.]